MSEDHDDAPEDTYDPSTVEIDRSRQQGLGVGERDLQGQRDPGDGLGPEDRPGVVDEAEDDEDMGDGFGRAEPVA